MSTMREIAAGRADAAVEAPAIAEVLRRAQLEFDWDACLPPRAGGWRWRLGWRLKRVLDVLLACLLLLLLAPVFLLTALLVKLTSAGPVFYRWNAVGERARPFFAYKFRTMGTDAEVRKGALLHLNEMAGPVFKMRHDPRITPLGRWLRKYSVDELPQLWSVIKGDMSLVGPRPPLPEEFVRFERWQWGKLAVTPGITCIWQVSGRSEISDFGEWAKLDLSYIAHWSLALDLRLLLRTVPAVLSARGAY